MFLMGIFYRLYVTCYVDRCNEIINKGTEECYEQEMSGVYS